MAASKVSIVIPVKDGGTDLARCLAAVRDQALDPVVEVVVIDSGSSDGSIVRATEAGARVIEIAPRDFNHGATRNIGAEAADGDVLVFLSQDAEPIGKDWLATLIAPLAEEGVAGVYGRQTARDDAVPPEQFFLDFVYGGEPRLQQASRADELSMETTLFSNVNSAMRRQTWEQLPFATDLIMSEDQDWSRRALQGGLRIVYEPRAVVRHSHPYTLGAAFRRFFDSGVSSERAYLAGDRAASRVLRRTALRYLGAELAWLLRSGRALWIPYALLYEATKLAGLMLGTHHRRLPMALKRRMSAMPTYWEQPGEGGGEHSP